MRETPPDREHLLALIGSVSERLCDINDVVVAAGVVLEAGLIDVKAARDMVEEVAPGCLDAVALSGLDETV